MTTCGYPQASWRVNDERIAEDFDIAIAFMDNLQPTDELDIWEFDTEQTDSRTSYPSSKKDEYSHIRSPNSKALLGDDQWNTCKGIHRNMWVTITRIKNSTEQASGPERTARQLQTFPPFYPNGTKFADLDITFTNYRGSGSFLKVVSLAFAAGLAALAFWLHNLSLFLSNWYKHSISSCNDISPNYIRTTNKKFIENFS